MWQIVCLQMLTCGVAIASLFLKTTADFNTPTSASAISVAMFREQANESKFLKRNLENIVRSISLNDAVTDAIKSIIIKHAGTIGYANVKVARYTGGLSS
jgi:hypothetical protein